MNIGTIPVLATLIVLLAIGAGIIWLQIFLSKKENKWLGLLLPIISLCISLIAVFGIAVLTVTTKTSVTTIEENGVVIQEAAPERTTQEVQDVPSLILTVVSVFLLYNIPQTICNCLAFALRKCMVYKC